MPAQQVRQATAETLRGDLHVPADGSPSHVLEEELIKGIELEAQIRSVRSRLNAVRGPGAAPASQPGASHPAPCRLIPASPL